jgi:transcription elongation factor GreA
MDRVPMTVTGAEALKAELEQLKTVDRPRVIDSIAEAREHVDLKENAEYHAAREEQGFIEGRIQEIEGKISAAEIIDISKMPNNGKVIFGTTVVIENLDTEEEQVWTIVGDDESDLEQRKISYNSPIARGLIGRSEGDEVTISTPGGENDFEIIEVRYGN